MFRKNRIPWFVGGFLILLLGVGAIVLGGGKKKSTSPAAQPESARVVVLPADRERTVIVPPCNSPVNETVSNAEAGRSTPGATIVELPRGGGVRSLLVPHCQEKQGSVNLQGNLPSAVFVIGGEERLEKGEGGKVIVDGVVARSQLVLPGGSSAATVVVPGCLKKQASKGRDVALGSEGSSEVVVAPAC